MGWLRGWVVVCKLPRRFLGVSPLALDLFLLAALEALPPNALFGVVALCAKPDVQETRACLLAAHHESRVTDLLLLYIAARFRHRKGN